MQNRSIIFFIALLAATAATPASFAQANLSNELKQPKAAVSPTLYGLMTEENNYSYDGGLYAELVHNRTFRSDWSGILNWYLVEKGSFSAKMSVDNKTGPSTALTTSAKLEVTKEDPSSPAGFINEGDWGMRTSSTKPGPMTAAMLSFTRQSRRSTPKLR